MSTAIHGLSLIFSVPWQLARSSCAITGGPKVSPPSVERCTAIAVRLAGTHARRDGVTSSDSAYTVPSGPNATVGFEARGNSPPDARVSPGRIPRAQIAPPSCEVAKPIAAEPPSLKRRT